MGCILFLNIFKHWCVIIPGTLMERVILESLAFAAAPDALFSLGFLQMLKTIFIQPQGPYWSPALTQCEGLLTCFMPELLNVVENGGGSCVLPQRAR